MCGHVADVPISLLESRRKAESVIQGLVSMADKAASQQEQQGWCSDDDDGGYSGEEMSSVNYSVIAQ